MIPGIEGLVTVAYIGATILFILALGGLSHPESARRGNLYGIIGMVVALVAVVFGAVTANYALLIGALAVGGVVAVGLYDVPMAAYVATTRDSLSGWDLTVGLLKGSVYAMLVALAGCRQGLNAGHPLRWGICRSCGKGLKAYRRVRVTRGH